MSDFKNTKLEIILSEKVKKEYLFWKNYNLELHNDFIKNKEDKKHNITSHTKWFRWKIKLNHKEESIEIINKWKLCMVDYGVNVWTEINWIRPSIVFKSSSAKYWEDIIVIPITYFFDWKENIKSIDEFDLEIFPDTENNLKNKSLLKIRQLRCVSKKRIKSRKWSKKLTIFWEIKNKELKERIKTNVRTMFWI